VTEAGCISVNREGKKKRITLWFLGGVWGENQEGRMADAGSYVKGWGKLPRGRRDKIAEKPENYPSSIGLGG